jgi:Protein of unknown function (DUF1217)
MMDVVSNFRRIVSDQDRALKTTESRPELKREIDYYRARIGNIRSLEEFMKDERLYRFAMTAFGLKDMIYAKAYMRKALTEGIDSPDAFSVRLADSRFREFVEAFNFKRYGSATTAFDRTQEATVARYVRNALEEQAGTQDESLRLALYFHRKAPAVTSVYSILADRALSTVVRTALGIPQAAAAADIDKQATQMSQKLNLADFKDPAKLNRFIDRFLGRHATENGGGAVATSPALAVFGSTGIDSNTLLSIQTLRRFNS